MRELERTRDRMALRGPDGCGGWASEDGRCLLGHRRLSIIDLHERADQPMVSGTGLSIVFNGEIYNFAELRSELESEGVAFSTTSDTEVLLRLYDRDGEAMVSRLRGMFAFAIHDARRDGLFIARDPFGIKPLYVANDGWTLRFASQVKALLAGGKVSRDREPAGIVGFHLLGSVPEPFTLYRQIRSFPAGHSQWIDRAGARPARRYFGVASVYHEALPKKPATALSSQLYDRLCDSVRAHLCADVKVGLFLSAGIDSSVLLALIRESGYTPRTITLGFSEFAGSVEDEVPLAARVAQYYGAEHVVRRVDQAEFKRDLPAILDAMDQPSIDGVNSWFVSKAAAETGLKVAISGLGSDEILGGYPSFGDVPRWRSRFGLPARIPGAGPLLRRLAPSSISSSRPKALAMLDHASSWGGAYLLRRGLFMPFELTELLGRDVVRDGLHRLNLAGLFDNALTPDPGSSHNHVSTLELNFYMRNQLLRDADWTGMAHSLEIRTPFVDSEFFQSVAGDVGNLSRGEGKAALARSPNKPLPPEISNRPKTGFGVPTGQWTAAVEGGQNATAAETKGLASRGWARHLLEAEFAA